MKESDHVYLLWGDSIYEAIMISKLSIKIVLSIGPIYLEQLSRFIYRSWNYCIRIWQNSDASYRSL